MPMTQPDDPITPDVFAHLVELAALELSEQEADYLRGELNQQLRAIHDLEAIDLPDQIEITSHGVPYAPEIRSELRADDERSAELADRILEQAPELEDRYLVVPDIPHTELE